MSKFIPKNSQKENISIRLPTDTLDFINHKAAEIGISRNQFLNQCIAYALANMADDRPEPPNP